MQATNWVDIIQYWWLIILSVMIWRIIKRQERGK